MVEIAMAVAEVVLAAVVAGIEIVVMVEIAMILAMVEFGDLGNGCDGGSGDGACGCNCGCGLGSSSLFFEVFLRILLEHVFAFYSLLKLYSFRFHFFRLVLFYLP